MGSDANTLKKTAAERAEKVLRVTYDLVNILA
jgi:hypothetical protein